MHQFEKLKKGNRFFFPKHKIFLISVELGGIECKLSFVFNYHMLKVHTLVLEISPILARETGSLTHSLCWTPFFGSCGVPWGPTPNLTQQGSPHA